MSKTYEFTVIETRTYDVRYVVEADSPEEAQEKAESGETEEEIELKCRDVLDRTIYSGPEELKHFGGTAPCRYEDGACVYCGENDNA